MQSQWTNRAIGITKSTLGKKNFLKLCKLFCSGIGRPQRATAGCPDHVRVDRVGRRSSYLNADQVRDLD